jgi:hypothetical protein
MDDVRCPNSAEGTIQFKLFHSKPERACSDPLALRLPLAMGLKPTEVLKAMTRAKVRHSNAMRLSSTGRCDLPKYSGKGGKCNGDVSFQQLRPSASAPSAHRL